MEKLLIVIVTLLIGLVCGLNNGLARTPPMGWLSWERFRCNVDCQKSPDTCISERLYMAMADKMVELGFKDLGYEYVNIDDCWSAKERDAAGNLVPDPERFPSGMKALADYVHAKGLKLGIYGDFGSKTCAGYPGSEFYMEADANIFAEWGIDMLKLDGCNSDINDMPIGYSTMGFWLNATRRPMLYSCSWPAYVTGSAKVPDYKAIKQHCNIWRNYIDVQDSWDYIVQIIDYWGNDTGKFAEIAGPGGYNDPDMLITGDFGLSSYQQKAQFGMWAMFAAPLFMSVDLRNIDAESISILQNKDVIAINQDPLGIQAVRMIQLPHSISVWMKPLVNNGTAIAFLNKDNQGVPTEFTIALGDYGLKNPKGYNVTDVFTHKNLGIFKPSSPFNVTVDPTSIVLVKVVPRVWYRKRF